MPPQLHPNEVVCLLVAIAIVPIIVTIARRLPFPGRGYLLAATLLLASAYVSTIAEGFAAPVFFNTLQHLGVASAGVFFLMAVLKLRSSGEELL